MAIILARRGKPVMKLERTIIQEENYLQRYLDEHPDILPLDQLQADIRPLVLVREFPTMSGPIDAIAVDQNANIYLIETKLYKNPDKRLVLAQVLDYGAALWKGYSDPDDFIFDLDSAMQKRTGKSLSQLINEDYGLEPEAASEFRARLKSTIASGRFRFVVLMDTIDDRLKNLIGYVNENSRFKLLGIGLDFYQQEDLDILIPTLHGAESVEPPKPPPPVAKEGYVVIGRQQLNKAKLAEELKAFEAGMLASQDKCNWWKNHVDEARVALGQPAAHGDSPHT